MQSKKLLPVLENYLSQFKPEGLHQERKVLLDQIAEYASDKLANGEFPKLMFVCTHNSRRSQLSQLWAKTAAVYLGINIESYSAGTEVTAVYPEIVQTIARAGFDVNQSDESDNPKYLVGFGEELKPLTLFSKLIENEINPTAGFASVMTCSHAEANCPFVPGAEKRFPLHYEDPKQYDGTPQEAAAYQERSAQIATEMLYLFSKIKS